MRYRTIVADPPWHYAAVAAVPATGRSQNVRRDGARAMPGVSINRNPPYASMSVGDIKALPVQRLCDPDGARMFLWTTNRYLRDAFDVLENWGFRYGQTLVWHKLGASPLCGGIAVQSAEYILVGQSGSVEVLSQAPSSVLSIGVPKEHSRKPEAWLDLVEQVSPEPRLELFARRNRLGWDTWGDEALEHVEMPA